ncbi:ANTAR domain-containing protein [Streptomyces mirabilis]|uniref:ANTAR domain-containing protein n=1 Tax=Streptomyces mirabilis TaxID=68239 RepID=UPI00267C5598
MDENRRLREENHQLKEGMQTRTRIDQAMGMVVALGGVTPDHARDLLREVSMNTHTKLRIVAEALVAWPADGALPDDVGHALGIALAAHTSAQVARRCRRGAPCGARESRLSHTRQDLGQILDHVVSQHICRTPSPRRAAPHLGRLRGPRRHRSVQRVPRTITVPRSRSRKDVRCRSPSC